MTSPRALLMGILCMFCSVLRAASPLEDAIERFVRERTAGIAGHVDIGVDAPDARLRALPCNVYEPFLPAGSRLWGRTTIGVRCAATASATVFVAVRIRVIAPAVVAARSISAGQILVGADLRMEETEITQPGVLTDPLLALGRRIVVGVNPGSPIRQELLRMQPVIAQGDNVRVTITGRGFTVTSEGIASAHASDGQPVQVRMESGRTVSGIARPDRSVEVKF